MTCLLYGHKCCKSARCNYYSDAFTPGKERLGDEDDHNDHNQSTTYADDKVFPRWVLDVAEKESGHIVGWGDAQPRTGSRESRRWRHGDENRQSEVEALRESKP